MWAKLKLSNWNHGMIAERSCILAAWYRNIVCLTTNCADGHVAMGADGVVVVDWVWTTVRRPWR